LPKPPDKFKRWMIASLFLIPLVLFGTTLGYYYFYTPIKMHTLIYLLGYDKTRDWAEKRIWSEREKAAPYLIRALSDPDVNVRASAAWALGYLEAKEAVPQLLKLLSDPDWQVRFSAAWALGKMGSEAAGELVKLLSNPDGRVRYHAAEALGLSKAKEAVPNLIRLLSDPAWNVRSQAAWALGEIGPDEAVGPLIASLKETPTPPAGTHIGTWRRFAGDAVRSLEKITGQNFGDIHAVGTDAQRQEIIQKWLYWWQENKDKYDAGGES